MSEPEEVAPRVWVVGDRYETHRRFGIQVTEGDYEVLNAELLRITEAERAVDGIVRIIGDFTECVIDPSEAVRIAQEALKAAEVSAAGECK